MANEIQVFENAKLGRLRVVCDEAGEPWFVAKDVCAALGISNVSQSLSNLDEDERMTISNSEGHSGQRGGAQSMNIISEAGLYSLILRSRKPEAKAFKRWVTHEVLPSIRKHGGYVVGQEQYINGQMSMEELVLKGMSWLTSVVKEQRENLAKAEGQIAEMQPKAFFADSVSRSEDGILVRELAKVLTQNGYDTGERRLYATLREDGYLIKSGRDRNRPTQRASELGLFRVVEGTRTDSQGRTRLHRTTLVTGAGQLYFVNRYCHD